MCLDFIKAPSTRVRIFLSPQTFSFQIRLPSTRIRWIWRTNPQLFESALQSANFWIRSESGIGWTLNLDIFLSGHVTRSSPVLYREYSIQDGNFHACSVANIPRGVLGTRVNPDTCRIRVDGQVRFEYGYVWKEKVADSKMSGYVWTGPNTIWEELWREHHLFSLSILRWWWLV